MPSTTVTEKVTITVPTEAFTEAVSYTAKAVAKAMRPEHRCVALSIADGKLTVRGTDVHRHRAISIDADGAADLAEVALPAKTIEQIVAKAKSDAISLTFSDKVVVKAGRRTYELPCLDASMLPSAPAVSDSAVAVTLDGNVFADVVKRVSRVTSDDITQPISAVQIACNGKALRAAGTDTYRLAYAVGEVASGGDAEALVPAGELAEMAAAAGRVGGEITLTFDAQKVAMRAGDHFETVAQRQGKYPDFVKILDIEGTTKVTIADTGAFREEVDAASITAPHGSLGAVLSFSFDEEEALVSSGVSEAGESGAELPCDVEGDAVNVRFTAKFLTEGLALAGGRQVVLHIVDPLKPTLINGGVVDGIAFKYLLMPTRS